MFPVYPWKENSSTCGGLRRIAADCGGLRRITADYGGLRRITADYGGLRRITARKVIPGCADAKYPPQYFLPGSCCLAVSAGNASSDEMYCHGRVLPFIKSPTIFIGYGPSNGGHSTVLFSSPRTMASKAPRAMSSVCAKRIYEGGTAWTDCCKLANAHGNRAID